MADKNQAMDVWIVENNTVYRAVPFAVVTDWVQQGRLLDDDRLRSTGKGDWTRLGDMPDFAPYIPKAEPHRADDTAEALEPVHMGFEWKPSAGDADEDVDMIPLIDVSLVLLVFFMMTAAVGGAGSLINTPIARYRLLSAEPQTWWIGISRQEDGSAEYTFGQGDGAAMGPAMRRPEEAVAALAGKLKAGDHATVRIRADEHLPIDVIRETTRLLEGLRVEERGGGAKVEKIMGEVREKSS